MENIEEKKTVGVVIFEGDKVLLVRHLEGAEALTGTWALPCGRLEEGESFIEAGKRELEEESGLVAELQDLEEMPTTYRAVLERKHGKVPMMMRTFLCRKYTGTLRGSSETEPEWVDLSRIADLRLLPNVATAIAEAQSFR